MNKTIRTFDEITTMLQQRKSAGAKPAAAVKSAATVDSVPEKDANEKGVVTVPGNPALDKTQTLSSSTNADTTPTLTPPSVDKTIAGSEPCSINMKVANTVTAIRELVAQTQKRAVAEKTLPAGTSALPTGQAAIKSKPAPSTEKGAPGTSADQAKGEKDPTEKGEVKVKSDVIDGQAKGNEVENTDKQATGNAFLEFTPEFHFKIASTILATEQGRQTVEALLLQELGAEAANDLVKAASMMEDQAAQAAAYEASGAAYADQLWEQASPDEQEKIIKIASIHEYQKSRFAEDEFGALLKQAYDQGAEAAAGQMDQSAAPPGAEGAAPGGAEGEEGGGQEASIDDIVEVLQNLVQSGQITSDVAEEILTKLVGGEEGGAAPGGAEDAMGAEGAAPPGADQIPPEISGPAEKAASIVNAILKQEAGQVPAATA